MRISCFLLFVFCFVTGCTTTTTTTPKSQGIIGQLGRQTQPSSPVGGASNPTSRTAIQIHVDEYGQMIYERQFVTAETLGVIFQREKIGKGRAVTLIALGNVETAKLLQCREELVAQGIANVVIVSAQKATSRGQSE